MKKVLIVEDTEEYQTIISGLLKKENIECVIADTGERALEILKTEEFTCAFVDLVLPGIDGYQVIKGIKTGIGIKSCHTIVVSKKKEREDIVKAIESGADDYITKPIDSKVLLGKIRALIKKLELSSSPQNAINMASENAKGRLNLDLEIYELLEDGFVFITDYIISKGISFFPSGNIFKVIGIEPPKLIVDSTTMTKVNNLDRYLIKTKFEVISVEDYLRVRRYILLKNFCQDKELLEKLESLS